MRCPYCGRNSERANYCTHCGRDLRTSPSQQPAVKPPPYQQSPQRYPTPAHNQQQPDQLPPLGYPTSASRQPTPYQQPRQVPPAQPHSSPTAPSKPQSRRVSQQEAPVRVPPPAPEPPTPEAPVPFPPHTVEQLRALEQGALAFNILDTTTDGKRKKTVRITYPKSVAWQQVATLLKAFKEQQETQFETIIIQGYLPQDSGGFTFTNGQLIFDRNVRLGGQTLNRYQIDTGNGLAIDSVRIVLSE